jgi:hypothetical protein
MTVLPVRFIEQQGDDDCGFYGEIYFPTSYSNGDGGVLYLHVDYAEDW